MRYALLTLVSLLIASLASQAQTYQTYPYPRQPYQQPQGTYQSPGYQNPGYQNGGRETQRYQNPGTQNPGYQTNPYGWNTGTYNGQYPQQNTYNQQGNYQQGNYQQGNYQQTNTYQPGGAYVPNPYPTYGIPRRRVQLALILDTSGSMEGLIGQAKAKLWSILNELSYAFTEPGTVPPLVEIALYEYGSARYYETGHVRQLVPFTLNLDLASEMLYSLTTTGSQEFAGLALQQAAYQLAWSQNPDDIKMIFLAGNESFYQGPVDYRSAIGAAVQRGITVHTIYCGSHQQGIAEGWAEGAAVGYGAYSSINHNTQVRMQPTYYDNQMVDLNDDWNSTYIPYGNEGVTCHRRQSSQDQNASQMGQAILAERLESKVGDSYSNPEWDLVDAVTAGRVNLATIPAEQLPQEMRAMTPQQRTEFVNRKREAREQLRGRIRTIAQSERAAAPAATTPAAQPAAQPANNGPRTTSAQPAVNQPSAQPASPTVSTQPGRTPPPAGPQRPGETGPARNGTTPGAVTPPTASRSGTTGTPAATEVARPAVENADAGTLDRAVIESARRARAAQGGGLQRPANAPATQFAPKK